MLGKATGSGDGRERRILVCEDERSVSRLIQVNLERQGNAVVCVFDGQEAIDLLEAAELMQVQSFDGIVLDVMMPKKDGYDVFVVFMVPYPLDLGVWRSLPYQADQYVAKPFNPMQLFTRTRGDGIDDE